MEVIVKFGSNEYPIIYRDSGSSDLIVIKEILENYSLDIRRYEQGKSLEDLYIRSTGLSQIPIIIDAGANIGIASLWFSIAYPGAKIISIEPEKENLKLLKQNVRCLDAVVIAGALAKKTKKMKLVDPGLGHWGYRISDLGTGHDIDAFSGADVLKKWNNNNYFNFICKIDIEGAESDIFSRDTSWIKSFPLIIIEIHDRMFPGNSKSKNFFKFISKGNYDVIHRGELIFAFNNDILIY